ncbi:hypothetical protein ACSNOH_18705 [Streptomyces sp. URMC 127]|uniref:hypothetical protein n=1 Tax=Streptomyces sp. URMC 127 TaxID=3423402 RepID=UPI003F1B1B4B
MSAATSYARSGDYDTANAMMRTAERAADRLAELPPPQDGRLVSVFSRSSVRIERVRLAVQHERPEEALALAEGAVKALEALRRVAPAWMRHHTLAVSIVHDLWSRSTRPAGLRTLAQFLGITE